MAMRKDCRLAERSLSGWGGWGEVVAVATDDPLDRDPPLRLCGFLFLCGMSTPLSLAELPPLLATAFGWTQIREWSDPLLLPKKERNYVNTRKTKIDLFEFVVFKLQGYLRNCTYIYDWSVLSTSDMYGRGGGVSLSTSNELLPFHYN